MNKTSVFIIDDDFVVRDSLTLLLETAGYTVKSFDSAEAFLSACQPDCWGCLVLDLRMPGMKGNELQAELIRRNITLPVIFLTAYGDIPTTVQAMKAGAMDFLTKPVDAALLLQRVREALRLCDQEQDKQEMAQELRERCAGLTRREREVLALAASGMPNKEIASRLGISYRTVELHRSNIYHKTGAQGLLELARIAEGCGIFSDE
ncbi:MAG: response regulator [Sulfuricella sp.]